MKVITIQAVTSDGTTYPAGETIDLPKDKADRLIELGVVKAASDTKTKEAS